MNHIEFISFLLEAPDFVERQWGRIVLNSHKFDFGPCDEMPILDTTEKASAYIEYYPRLLNLPFDNCLFCVSNSLFLHVRKRVETNVIETRFCSYNEDDECVYYSPVVGFMDEQVRPLHAEPFLGAAKREKQKELEELAFHFCMLANPSRHRQLQQCVLY